MIGKAAKAAALLSGVATLALAVLTWRLQVQASDDLQSGAASVVLGLPQAPLGFALAALAATSTILMGLLTWQSLTGRGAKP